jgi:hypothetical protein
MALRDSLDEHQESGVESFLVCGWSPRERRRPESLLLARVGSDGSLKSAGSVPLVLANGSADGLRRELEPLVLPPPRRGQGIRRAPALPGRGRLPWTAPRARARPDPSRRSSA